jgi:cyclopropane fatty-acyl-phospholipid synthase-like methyltransferase
LIHIRTPPSLSEGEVFEVLTSASALHLRHPLRVAWSHELRANFEAATARLEDLGYDERFRRLWRMYLAYCEAGFARRRTV